MEKYRVTLTADERNALEKLVSVGRAAARKLTHARILGSIGVPGSYVSKSSSRAPNNAFPRRLTL